MVTSFTDWEGTCLVHHGIKGQKWGVRRYQNPDGTLTALGRANLGVGRRQTKAYNRGIKKLNKLRDKADVELQRSKSKKYLQKAKQSGKIAATLGVSTVASYANDLLRHRVFSDSSYKDFEKHKAAQELYEKLSKPPFTSSPAESWNRSMSAYSHKNLADQAYDSFSSHYKMSKPFAPESSSFVTKALAGATIGAAGYAAYNAVRSKVANHRITTAGHRRAVRRYKNQYKDMVAKYKDTPYLELLKKQKKKK